MSIYGEDNPNKALLREIRATNLGYTQKRLSGDDRELNDVQLTKEICHGVQVTKYFDLLALSNQLEWISL